MTLGFTSHSDHSFQPVWANDYNAYCAETYNLRFGNHCVYGDIANVLRRTTVTIPETDVVIGGPPCQGFSLLNRNRAGDHRRQLWRKYFQVVKKSGAKVFVMENVPQLLESPEFEEIRKYAEDKLQFKIAKGVLLAADYGDPQMRRRAIILGSRIGDPETVFPPKRTHYNPKKEIDQALYVDKPAPWRTVRDAFQDLGNPVGTSLGGDDNERMRLHFGRNPTQMSLERYMMIPPGGNRFQLVNEEKDLRPGCWIRKTTGGTDLFGRLLWDQPAVTIRTEFFKPEKGRYLHPEQDRPITHREAARIQSFPDDFHFCGSKIEIARQIGNAVPVRLASRIADSVYTLLANDQKALKARG